MDFAECIRDGIGREGLASGIHSLILFGSYVRGDFIEGVSDLDLFAVLTEDAEMVMPGLTSIIEGCTSSVRKIRLDIPWGYLSEMDDPLNKGFPYKFLTFYQEDFLENHVVVYGEGIEDILPRYDRRELSGWRAARLLGSPERFRDDPRMLRVSAGEAIRFMALMNGAEGIGKGEIHSTLERMGDEEALEVFEAYLEGRELERSEEYWTEFITSRVRKLLDE